MPRTILVVDDTDSDRILTSRILTRAGYQVESASGVREALALLEQRTYDAVVTDLEMPEGGGKALGEEMQKRKSRIPIFIVTGHPAEDMIEVGKKEGISPLINQGMIAGFFPKEHIKTLLLPRLKEYLSPTPTPQDNKPGQTPESTVDMITNRSLGNRRR